MSRRKLPEGEPPPTSWVPVGRARAVAPRSVEPAAPEPLRRPRPEDGPERNGPPFASFGVSAVTTARRLRKAADSRYWAAGVALLFAGVAGVAVIAAVALAMTD